MPAGAEFFNDSGSYQIDGQYKNLALLRSGSVVPAQDTGTGSGTNTYNAQIQVNLGLGEILALSCGNYFTFYWSTNNAVTVRVFGASPPPVKYYIFGVPAATVNFGMQIFNDSGALAYDSSWKVFNVKSILTANGSFYYSEGREYAVVFISQYAYRNQDFFQQPGGGNIYFVNQTYETDLVRINSNLVEVDTNIAWQISGLQFMNPPIPPNGSYTNGLTTKIMVLDVTGY